MYVFRESESVNTANTSRLEVVSHGSPEYSIFAFSIFVVEREDDEMHRPPGLVILP